LAMTAKGPCSAMEEWMGLERGGWRKLPPILPKCC